MSPIRRRRGYNFCSVLMAALLHITCPLLDLLYTGPKAEMVKNKIYCLFIFEVALAEVVCRSKNVLRTLNWFARLKVFTFMNSMHEG